MFRVVDWSLSHPDPLDTLMCAVIGSARNKAGRYRKANEVESEVPLIQCANARKYSWRRQAHAGTPVECHSTSIVD